ncbi:alpha/beta-hydrolase [Fomitiporia mediterranea MF3/22]|uniref:alpha/beta-hydrolase n=1 Tax=Fomitiporia mediterranea (strain MF3/22) TaxID=694068 RepID=UPI0004409104|nr:alpha/beta-hydrolase [Fomitiporia mediterranea MF3/22]EJC99879.1 alpha/beta-hydrolase [Fomitiporia mediterranea MF3/22]
MADKVLAGEPGDDCCRGVRHFGEPKGKIEKIAGVDTYITAPPQGTRSKGVILFYADVWGPVFINNKLIQDYFATQGYDVVGIDYFFGDPVYIHDGEQGFDRPAWMAKSKAQAAENEPKWFQVIKERYGQGTKYFAVGYCFGAPYVLEAGSTGKTVAGAIAHPAFLNEKHFFDVTAPLMLSCSEIDHTFPTDLRRRAEDILVERKHDYHFQVFGGVSHGFAVRGDPNNSKERFAKEESARGIIAWFDRFA